MTASEPASGSICAPFLPHSLFPVLLPLASAGRIETLVREAQAAYSPDELDRISKLLQQEVKKSGEEAKRGKGLLDAMKRKGESLASRNAKGERVQPYKTQYMRLCKLYVETMKEHQRSKEAMRKTQTDTLVRRGEIVFGDTKSREEIKEAVDRDPGGFLREAILTESSEEAQQAFTDAQSRARDIEMLVKCVPRSSDALPSPLPSKRSLSSLCVLVRDRFAVTSPPLPCPRLFAPRSLNEVATMFQDLAALVQQQSDMLDSIENNVESATTYVKKGNANLRTAIELQKKTRKCYCCLLCIVIAIVIALVAGLGTFFSGAIKKA